MLLSWLCFYGAGSNVALALDPSTGLQQYNHRTWSRQNGLPVNGITSIAQAKDGYLWFGSAAGLVRFDGIQFQLHDLHSAISMRGSAVSSVAPARAGGVWVGLENNAFGAYDGRAFSFHGELHPEATKLNIRSLAESKDGSLWLGGQGRIARLSPSGEWKSILADDPSTNLAVNGSCVHEGPKGRIWLGTYRHGVYLWQNDVLTKIPDPTLDALNVRCLAEDADGNIWIGSQEGLRCYDATLRRREIPEFGMEIRALLADRRGALWIGTSGHGLIRQWQGGYDTLPNFREGPGGEFVQALAEDHEGSLWIGTRDGVVQISDVKFPIHPPALDPAIKDASAVGASRGGVWIASGGGVALFDPATKNHWMMPGLPKPYSKRVFEARNGDVYVVNGYRDLAVFSGGKIAVVHPARNMVVGMAEDLQGVVVSVGAELYRAGPDHFHPYEFKGRDKPRFDWILNLAPGRDGSLWVATVNGIFRVKDGEYRQWGAAVGLADLAVLWICEDSEGVVWAGLLSGVARLKDDRIRHIGRKDGLFDDNIYAIVPDDLGNLWLDSARGIFRASRRDMNDFVDGKKPRVECAVFDGLESVKVSDKSGQERVGCKTSDGRIWFPGPRGVVMIDPANVLVNRAPPPVHIARVRANRREIDLDHAVVEPGEGKSGLEFHFDALSFLAPQKVKFRHRLVGYDKDWVEATDRRVAFYPDLPPGRYTLRVVAANADGIWNEEGDSLELELRPLFSETIWFRLLCAALALGALAGVYLWRIRYLTRQRRELQKSRDLLETEVRHRTAELATANQTLRQDIEERSRLQAEIDKIHKELLEQSRAAGMAEVATNVLHNVGNVLNSINVSATLVADRVRRSKTPQIGKICDLFDQHRSDLGVYLSQDAKGRMIPAYLANLAASLAVEQEAIVAELESLRKNIDHVKDIVAMQQSYAKTSGVLETVSVPELVEDALRMNAGSLARHQIEIARDYEARPVITVDKNKVLQILVNLIRNAKYACDESGRTDKLITLRTTAAEHGVDIAVIDNGVGIPAENLTRIFAHGFTTRKHGHGFGLHSGALAAKEMGGSLKVHSDGRPGCGATFTLRLPFASTERNGSSGRNDT